ncbi:MAG: sulfite exporter TauE/SafE family protein [Clostridiales bacterium]|nr:sulfite exporter TauE/SafE family protein [Clostridiales bacterium]
MEFVWYATAGVLSGILGGMGMGGGTILIPLLSIFYKVGQHTAQAINLIGFIPMSVVALIIHFKNKLVDFKNVIKIVLPGIATCIVGCFIARAMSADLLKRCFGGFLIILSVFQLLTELKKIKND